MKNRIPTFDEFINESASYIPVGTTFYLEIEPQDKKLYTYLLMNEVTDSMETLQWDKFTQVFQSGNNPIYLYFNAPINKNFINSLLKVLKTKVTISQYEKITTKNFKLTKTVTN